MPAARTRAHAERRIHHRGLDGLGGRWGAAALAGVLAMSAEACSSDRAEWLVPIPGIGNEMVFSVAGDASGNVYASVGAGSVTPDEALSLLAIGPDASIRGVASLTNDGFRVFGPQFALASNDRDVVGVGGFDGTFDLGCGAAKARSVMGDGALAWLGGGARCKRVVLMPGVAELRPVGVTLSSTGEALVTAYGPGKDSSIVRFRSGGDVRWEKDVGPGDLTPVVGPRGTSAVFGIARGDLDFGAGVKVSATSEAMEKLFLVGLTDEGLPRFVVEGKGQAIGAAINERDDRIYVSLGNSETFAGQSADPSGSTYMALDSGGRPEWSFSLRGFGSGPVADATGGLILCGSMTQDVTIRGTTIERVGESDAVVIKLDKSGNVVWWSNGGVEGASQSARCAVAPGGDILVAGEFSSAIDFGSGEVKALHREDGYVARLRN